MKIVDFSKSNTVVNKFIAELRDVNVQSDRLRFRRNLERIGEVMAYEISKDLEYHVEDVTSPLGIAEVSVPSETIVAATILRAGLPVQEGVLNIFDGAENAFVSAYRRYDQETDFNFNISVEYISSPSLDGKVLIICDAMLATGSSMQLAYEALLAKGMPKRLYICAVIASREALEYLQENLPEDSVIYVAAVDEMLDQHKFIVPGLGDAGDLAFGQKR